MTEAEIARDLHGVLEKVRQGAEVVVEDGAQTVAVILKAQPDGRLLSECLAIGEARRFTTVPDEGFARDVEEGIRLFNKPWSASQAGSR